MPNCFKIRSVDSDKRIFTGFPFGYHGNTNSARIFVKEDYPSIIPVKFGEISPNDLGDVVEPIVDPLTKDDEAHPMITIAHLEHVVLR